MKKQWWHDKIAYQVYPKSFNDTNSDGIGDLRGVIEKLDYIKSLGVDIIWLSPMYKSPFVDQGYDIADYYNVDPIFGTMEDMDELIAEVNKRGMHLLLDLVINHCSSEHEWFQKALADPYGAYGDYFYMRKGTASTPPNNLRSAFGGSVWEKVPNTEDLYYLHMFAKEQPDLNFENPVVREKIYTMMNWWLEKGIAGYRIDAIINIKKDLTFPMYPVDGPDGFASPAQMFHETPGILDILNDIKANTFDKHNALTIAELFDYDAKQIEEYIGERGCFSSIFVFDTHVIGQSSKGWYDWTRPTAETYKHTLYNCLANAGDIGMMCSIIENHDEPRGVSRYLPDTNNTSKKMLATVFMYLKGLPFLYQGQEIGMESMQYTDIAQIDDLYTVDEYNRALRAGKTVEEALEVVSFYGRDNARTPMQWDDSANAGFSTTTPWLAANPNYPTLNVAQQQRDPDSVLQYYKTLIALRKDPAYTNTFVYGSFEPAYVSTQNLLAFYRKDEAKTLLVLCNFQNATTSIALPHAPHKTLTNNIATLDLTEDTLTLAPYQAVVFEI